MCRLRAKRLILGYVLSGPAVAPVRLPPGHTALCEPVPSRLTGLCDWVLRSRKGRMMGCHFQGCALNRLGFCWLPQSLCVCLSLSLCVSLSVCRTVSRAVCESLSVSLAPRSGEAHSRIMSCPVVTGERARVRAMSGLGVHTRVRHGGL